MGLAGTNDERKASDRSQRRGTEREFDDGVVVAHCTLAQAQKEDRQLLTEIPGQSNDGLRARGLVDGGAWQGLEQHRVEPVTELGVKIVAAQHAANEPLPGECALIGQ